MRVLQFVTLFLALSVVCGCSHRRAQRNPVTPSFCECSTCRSDQERLIREGAIPAEHFQGFQGSEIGKPVEATAPFASSPVEAPLAAPPAVNDFAPEYSSEPSLGSTTKSRYSSGNPIEMDKAPQAFSSPVVDEISPGSIQLTPNNKANDLQLDLRGTNEDTPFNLVPTETVPDGAFKPFDRDVFKVKSKIENTPPLSEQPSILIDKVSETYQPDLSGLVPSIEPPTQVPELDDPEANDFQIPRPLAAKPFDSRTRAT